MQSAITEYYNEIASEYDKLRFDNSYGKILDRQERRILKKHLPSRETGTILDAGCGTGRLSNFATDGIDISGEMIAIAQKKNPHCRFYVSPAGTTPFRESTLDAAFSIHLFMHLDINTIENILNQIHAKLKTGGTFIFDIPSTLRRSVTGYKPDSWRCGTSQSLQNIKQITYGKWNIRAVYGINFLPMHRIPSFIRRFFYYVEIAFSRTPVKYISSYTVYVLVKRDG